MSADAGPALRPIIVIPARLAATRLPNKPLARALQAFRDFLASGDLEPWSNEALLAGDADESDE